MGIFGGGSAPKAPKPLPPPELPPSMVSPDVTRAAMFARVGNWSGFAGTRKASRPGKKNPALQSLVPGGRDKGGGGGGSGSKESGADSFETPAAPTAPEAPAPAGVAFNAGTINAKSVTDTFSGLTVKPLVKPKGKGKDKGKGKGKGK